MIQLHILTITKVDSEVVPEVDSNLACLAVISLDSALKKVETIICKYF